MRISFHRKVWMYFLAFGVLGLGFFTLRLSPPAESSVFITYSFASGAAIFIGVYLNRPRPLAGWLVMGAGQVFNLLGDITYTRSVYMQDPRVPAGLFDGLYLCGQLCFVIGLAQVFYCYRKLINVNAVAQGAMVVIGLSTLVWVQQVSPNLGKGFGWLDWARVLVYPACMLAIFSVAAVFLMTGMRKNWSYSLFFAGGLAYALGLNLYSQIILQSGPLFETESVQLVYRADLLYALAYLLIGTAFLHPDLAAFRDKHFEKAAGVSRTELVLLAAAFWSGPVAYTLSNRYSIKIDELLILVSMLAIFGLNGWRLARLVQMLEMQNRELSEHREMLHHQAFHDALTGLPNRAFLYNHLEELIEQIRILGVPGAVFLIDVNNFKQVNDTLGHDEGDRVLKDVSNAFSALMRKEDVVGRWGGDEFMMVLRNLPDEGSARSLARRLQQEMRWTVSGSEGSVAMSISIGICLIPTGHEKMQTIVKKADLALYQAKRSPDLGIALSAW